MKGKPVAELAVPVDDGLIFLGFRACRLKKKAQHEANKIKLWGLNQEYGEQSGHFTADVFC